MGEERIKPEYLDDIPESDRRSLGRTSYGTVRVSTPRGVFEVQRGSRPVDSKQKSTDSQATSELEDQ